MLHKNMAIREMMQGATQIHGGTHSHDLERRTQKDQVAMVRGAYYIAAADARPAVNICCQLVHQTDGLPAQAASFCKALQPASLLQLLRLPGLPVPALDESSMMMAPTEQALARAKQAIAPLCTASPLIYRWAVPALKKLHNDSLC